MKISGAAGVVGLVLAALLFSKKAKASVMNTTTNAPVPAADWRAKLNAEQKANYAKYLSSFETAARKHGVPLELLLRQAYQESRFRSDIISGKKRSKAGAVGIMQIIPKWHPALDPGDAAADERAALNVPTAADYGAAFMAKLYKKYGRWDVALAAYNAGPGNVDKYRGVPPFAETVAYVREITRDAGIVV